MMNTRPNQVTQLKKIAAAPLFALLFFVFAEKVEASHLETPADAKGKKSMEKANAFQPVEKNLEPGFASKIDEKTVIKKTQKLTTPKRDTIKPKTGGNNTETKKIEDRNAENVSVNDQGDEKAEFPGGYNAMRKKIAEEFNTSVFSGKEGLVKTDIRFIIDKDGNAKNFTAKGGNEVFNQEGLRAAQKVLTSEKWKPAMKNGYPIDFYFNLPFTMSFSK